MLSFSAVGGEEVKSARRTFSKNVQWLLSARKRITMIFLSTDPL